QWHRAFSESWNHCVFAVVLQDFFYISFVIFFVNFKRKNGVKPVNICSFDIHRYGYEIGWQKYAIISVQAIENGGLFVICHQSEENRLRKRENDAEQKGGPEGIHSESADYFGTKQNHQRVNYQ